MIAEALKTLRSWLTPVTPELHVVAHPNSHQAMMMVQVGPEKYDLKVLDGPWEHIPLHHLTSVPILVRYLHRQAELGRLDERAALVLVESSQVQAIFDDRGLRQGAVTVPLVGAPAFRPWAAKNSKFMSPKEAQMFLRALPGEVVGTVGGQRDVNIGMYLLEQLAALSIIKTSDVKFQLSKTGFVKLVAQQEGRELTAQFPERFTLRLPIFRDLAGDEGSVLFDVEILVHTDEGQNGLPVIAFEVARMHDLLELAMQKMVEQLQQDLGEVWMVGLGTPNCQLEPRPVADCDLLTVT